VFTKNNKLHTRAPTSPVGRNLKYGKQTAKRGLCHGPQKEREPNIEASNLPGYYGKTASSGKNTNVKKMKIFLAKAKIMQYYGTGEQFASSRRFTA